MRTESRELLAVGIFGGGSRIGDRIETLLRRGRTFSPRASSTGVAASAIVLGGLMLAGSLAPRWIAFAQEQPRLTFEVASLKPSAGGRVALGEKSPGTFYADNYPLAGLIMEAYGIRNFQISGGPGWIHSDKYDILAKHKVSSRERPLEEMDAMLRSLLEDRFKLKVHRETKQLPLYALTVAKSGLKLREGSCVSVDPNKQQPQPAAGEKPPNICESRYGNNGPNRTLDWTGTNITDFTRWALPNIMSRTVIDKTGLAGRFDIHLEWTPDQATAGLTGSEAPVIPGGASPAGDTGTISIFTAIQEQLGLKLESEKGPVEVIVVDHVEKPDAN